MTKAQLTIAALTTLALAQGAYIMVEGQPVQVEIVGVPTDVVAEVDVETQAKIAEVRADKDLSQVACAKCETGLWDGQKRVLTQGWCCNGAWMPQPIADKLDTAAVAKPVEEEAIEP